MVEDATPIAKRQSPFFGPQSLLPARTLDYDTPKCPEFFRLLKTLDDIWRIHAGFPKLFIHFLWPYANMNAQSKPWVHVLVFFSMVHRK